LIILPESKIIESGVIFGREVVVHASVTVHQPK